MGWWVDEKMSRAQAVGKAAVYRFQANGALLLWLSIIVDADTVGTIVEELWQRPSGCLIYK